MNTNMILWIVVLAGTSAGQGIGAPAVDRVQCGIDMLGFDRFAGLVLEGRRLAPACIRVCSVIMGVRVVLFPPRRPGAPTLRAQPAEHRREASPRSRSRRMVAQLAGGALVLASA